MPKNNTTRAELGRVALGAVLGAVVSLLLAMALTALLALLVSSGRVGEGSERAMTATACFLASAAGALAARMKNKGAALASGLGAALIAAAVRCLIGLLSDTSAGPDGADLAVCLALLAGGTAVGLIRPGKRRHRR